MVARRNAELAIGLDLHCPHGGEGVRRLRLSGQLVGGSEPPPGGDGQARALPELVHGPEVGRPGGHRVELRRPDGRGRRIVAPGVQEGSLAGRHPSRDRHVREAVEVLCIEGRPGSARYLAYALEPERSPRPQIRPTIGLENALLERNLRAILDKGKARDEAAILAEMEETASTITGLTGMLLDTYRLLGDSYKRPGALPEYYVTSYQDLSLGDHLGIFEPWDHDHFDRQGNYEGTVRGLRGAKCTCNASRKSQIPDCPKCGTAWRGCA